jgi:predicted lipoprotein with Yx(FWY)xxD motif
MLVVANREGRDMLHLQGQRSEPSRRGGRPTGLALMAAAAVLVLGASLAAMALAASTPTVSSTSSSKLGEQIAVNAQGRTLYALSPETIHHLLCKGECFKFWPPLTVSSRKVKLHAGPGVHGSLGVLRRSNGLLQVTLRGLPLYRFAGDHAKGEVNGQGIKSFGGTWHAVTAAADPSGAQAPGSGASGSNNGSGGGGGYESQGTSTTSTNPTATTPTSTTPTTTAPTNTAPKEEPKEKAKEEKPKEEPWY